MNYHSAMTQVEDPYAAGLELGERLSSVHPEVVILFCTPHYVDTLGTTIKGLKARLGQEVMCCGGTGDGVYETTGVADRGICALGINTNGNVEWKAFLSRGAREDSLFTMQNVADRVRSALKVPPNIAFVMGDGLTVDGSLLVEGLQTALIGVPFGGLAADDRKFRRSCVFLNDDVAQDSVMMLGASGKLPFRIGAASGWTPEGKIGKITAVDGKTVQSINGRPALDFFSEHIRRKMVKDDLSVFPVAVYSPGRADQFVLRSLWKFDEATGSVTFFGRISQGADIRICTASIDDLLGGIRSAVAHILEGGFEPEAAVVISCAGRKWLFSDSGKRELQTILEELGHIPLIGIPSFGEIAPFRASDGKYSHTMFHNLTFVIGVFGK